MATTEDNRFIHSGVARLLALVIALVLLVVFVLTFQDDIGKPLMAEPETNRYLPPVSER